MNSPVVVDEMLAEREGQPTWEVARLFPNQGHWREEEYLSLESNHFVEFSHGFIEVLPMPTIEQQDIVAFLYQLLLAFVQGRQLGRVYVAPLPVLLWPGKYREPDIAFFSAAHPERLEGAYPQGADLLVEVVSGSSEDRRRDLVVKREEYARARVAEYWIVDPQQERIIVLRLEEDEYIEHGSFRAGATATSVLLAGFAVEVDAVFAAAGEKKEE